MRKMRQITKLQKERLFKFSPILIVAFLFFLNMAPRKLIKEGRIVTLLNNLKSEYESENLKGFFKLVDKNYPDFLEAKEKLENEFISKNDLELKFIIDAVLRKKEKDVVKLHWYKKYRDLKGDLYKEKGKATFIFHKDKLLQIKGKNPFFD